jgi:hypothetical protein
MEKKILIPMILLAFCLLLAGCAEPYGLQSTDYEEALVVEATITNEMKNQEVKISKTYKLEESGPAFQTGANVYITDDLGNNYDFAEQAGKYVSTSAFSAQTGRTYTLFITTSDGKSYHSSPAAMTTATTIESMTATAANNSDGESGVSIKLNSYDSSGTSKYYRYEYIETFKVIPPYWNTNQLIYSVSDDTFYIVPRTEETRVCYSSQPSNAIIQTSTSDQSEDRVSNFEVRFISQQNYIISYRYSILVKQYVQSLESYSYYETLKKINGSESLLSQVQPGFFNGNIKNTDNPNEKVIGFFDVSSVSERRIFFNYSDLFPDDPIPPYFEDCEIYDYDINAPFPSPKDRLIRYIEDQTLRYWAQNGSIYSMVLPQCGDCTSFSSNAIPSFWID